jgi:hypothetical protein
MPPHRSVGGWSKRPFASDFPAPERLTFEPRARSNTAAGCGAAVTRQVAALDSREFGGFGLGRAIRRIAWQSRLSLSAASGRRREAVMKR